MTAALTETALSRIRADVRAMHAYTVQAADGLLKMDAMENPFGLPPALQAALGQRLGALALNRYPGPRTEVLRDALARHAGMPEGWALILGNGSDELISLVALACARPGAQVLAPLPGFVMYGMSAQLQGLGFTGVALTPDFELDAAAMEAAIAQHRPAITYIAYPNNPTATITPDSEIAPWINSAPASVTFLFDEAYHEYVTDPRYQSAVKWVQAGKPNVIVTRTFSKIHALAGLRIGYTLAAPATTARLNEFCSIDNTNIAAAVAANASLQDTAFIQRSLQATALARQITTKALDELGLEYLPSQANFMLHRVKGSSAAYREEMKKRHMMVGRPFDHYDGWNRLTLGTPGEMTAFVAVLKDMRRQGLV